MARKWPDNSAGGCWARVPARGSEDIPKASSNGYLGLFVLNLSPTSLRKCSPFLHWAQAWEVEGQALCRLLPIPQVFCRRAKTAHPRAGGLWTDAQ